jgi:alpha-amylase/alpha-mannosidase (GH57 family)
LRDLFAEERHRIVQLLSQENLTRLDQLYTQVYRENYGVMMAFHRDELPVPVELQVAAEVALGHRCLTAAKALELETEDPEALLAEIEAIATEAGHLRCQLKVPEVKQILEKMVWRSLEALLQPGSGAEDRSPVKLETDIRTIERLIAVGDRLSLGLCLDKSQELYFDSLYSQIVPLCLGWLQLQDASAGDSVVAAVALGIAGSGAGWDLSSIRQLLQLGQTLAVDVECWLNQLN